MEMRKKTLLPAIALVGALSVSSAASAQQSATADDAKALLAKAATAVKADKPSALAKFDAPNGGFKDRDLYVFCFDRRSGIVLAGPPTTKGRDIRTLRDPTGKMFGQEMFANVKDGDVITEDYMFPKPNSTVPVAKESFIEGLGDVACGVGYYTTSAQAVETYRESPGSTMPVPSSWGSIRREPSTKPASGVSIRPYPG
jgi:signal transduction histidine kinase